MREIKFLKDLPIKLTNNNKRVLKVVGGDIYYDADGNRYGYITFNNVSKSPIFSLQLAIREFSIDGKFVRDNEYFEPYIYYPSGNFVINEPIVLDKDTEAVEVTIVKVTLESRNFINDKFVGFKAEDYIDLYQRKAPIKKPGTATTFSFNQPVNNQNPSNNDGVNGDVEYEDGAAPLGEQQSGISIEREITPSEITQFGKPQKNFWRFIYPLVGIAALVIILFVVMSIVTANVNMFNELF